MMAGALQQKSEFYPSVTAIEFAKFCEYFYERTGILFDEKKRYIVERHLQARFAKTKSSCFRDYFRMLRFDASGKEMQAVVNLLTINETYFFREDYQFQALVDGVLPELVKNRPANRTIRIWSMPCSTGEEPYSVALYILEKWDQADAFCVEIAASDIDSRVLEEARTGIYGDRSLQRLSPDIIRKYFSKLGHDQYQICRELRDSINFSCVNITSQNDLRSFRGIDVIYCRNMLIYFDDVSRRVAVEALYECMVPGGFICLGHSESMSRMSSLFRPRKFGETIIYQKPFSAE